MLDVLDISTVLVLSVHVSTVLIVSLHGSAGLVTTQDSVVLALLEVVMELLEVTFESLEVVLQSLEVTLELLDCESVAIEVECSELESDSFAPVVVLSVEPEVVSTAVESSFTGVLSAADVSLTLLSLLSSVTVLMRSDKESESDAESWDGVGMSLFSSLRTGITTPSLSSSVVASLSPLVGVTTSLILLSSSGKPLISPVVGSTTPVRSEGTPVPLVGSLEAATEGSLEPSVGVTSLSLVPSAGKEPIIPSMKLDGSKLARSIVGASALLGSVFV